MTTIQNYLNSLGYLDKAYYYFANEPQDQADYDAVAWYSRHLKNVAPGFKLMVSEEPKSEIYNHSDYVGNGQVDIWLPVLNNYDPATSHDRKKNHGEDTWIYFLHSTRLPYFNPITLDHPGIESKFTGWFLWKYRVGGIAYYSLNNWSRNPWTDPMNSNHSGDLFMLYPPSITNTPIAYGSNNHRFVPSIRFELMRDSLEDYEYFFVMNGNTQPQVDVVSAPDTQVDKIIKGVASYTRDSGFMYNLRRLIGLYVGGEISSIPDISPPVEHPRAEGTPGDYYINFQDPYGTPSTTYTENTYGNGYTYRYLPHAGHDYLQVGTEKYDVTVSDSKLTLDIGIWDDYTMINYLDIEAVVLIRCQGDLDPDGQVNQADLALFAGVYGTECESKPNCMGDFDGDSEVDGTDLAIFIEEFGNTECFADDSSN